MKAWRFGAVLALGLQACMDVAAPGAVPPAPLPASLALTAPAAAEPGEAINFGSNLARPAPGLTLHWDFGDGATAQGATTTHRFERPGDYAVALTVSNEAGASLVAQTTVTVRRLSMVRGGLCTGTGSAGWCWQQPKPTGNAIVSISFAAGQVAWALGEAGTVFKSTDLGQSWWPVRVPGMPTLLQAHFADATQGWLLGDHNALLRTADGGLHWEAQETGATSESSLAERQFQALGPDSAVLVDAFIDVRVTRDAGQSWSVQPEGFKVLASPDGLLWRQVGAQLQRSDDLGTTYATVLTLPAKASFVSAPRFQAGGLVWVVSLDLSDPQPPRFFGRFDLWTSADSGITWRVRTPSALANGSLAAQSINLFKGGEGWAEREGSLMRSVDHGDTWAQVPRPGGAPGLGLKPHATLDAHTAIGLVTFAGEVVQALITRDGGAHWSTLRAPAGLPAHALGSLQLGPDGSLWQHVSGGHYRSSDDGATWTKMFGPPSLVSGNPRVAGLRFHDAFRGIALTAAGSALDSPDGGVTWSARALVPVPVTLNRAKLQFLDPRSGWASLGDDTVHRTADGGTTWAALTSPELTGGILAFHFADAERGFAVRSDLALLRSNDGGQTWAAAGQVPFRPSDMHFSDIRTGVVVGNAGQVAYTGDGGARWHLAPSGSRAPLLHVAAMPGGVLWACGHLGSLLRSNDGGQTWAVVPVPTQHALYAIAFADATHGWVVGDWGTILATRDGGGTWAVQASGARVALTSVFAADAYTAWVGTDAGGVLATATGGR